MIGLFVAAGVLGLILLFLRLPVTVEAAFHTKFFLKIRLAGIKVFALDPDKPKKEPQKHAKKKDAKPNQKPAEKPNFFQSLQEKFGFSGAISKLWELFKGIINKFVKLLRRISFKKIELTITVSGEDAAQTAIRYGELSAAVYPVFSLLDTASNVQIKTINLYADFNAEHAKLNVDFSLHVQARLLFLIILTIGILLEWMKFKKQGGEEDEREQH